MELNELTAISPVDGRYREMLSEFSPYFSEFGLIRKRVFVEIEYFIALCKLPLPQLKDFDKNLFSKLTDISKNFSTNDALRIKEIEKTTNHDVKAVELYIREKFDALGISNYKEFVHFGLTSQDINNTAIPLLIKESTDAIYFPLLNELTAKLNSLSEEWKNIPMLSRTHGQPASPTKLGKEIFVFVERLKQQQKLLNTIPYSAKFGGAIGNFNAHHVAYPQIDWVKFSNNFVNDTLGLTRSQTTTQIEHYDNFAAFCDNLKRINTILIDLNRDIWLYISMNYFKQKIKKNEVGSSTMPHKVNPINFENSEGNLGMANAVFEHFSSKLPISRLQRDLSDSTVMRNMGVPIAYTVIAMKSLLKGLNKLLLNETAIKQDLQDNWSVVAEAIQTVLRREGYKNPYEALKALTRSNEIITKETIHKFINTLNVENSVKEELKKIAPENYTGIF
ncbi:MAG: adenylosuccinate lyase [Bacteroidales bacterium]|nr:adenylosuccinate lyase [Bacteroidales bacterium]